MTIKLRYAMLQPEHGGRVMFLKENPEICKLSAEEKEFLSALFSSECENMTKIANIRLQNIHEAQDAVQETFLVAQKNIEKIMRSENPKGWLMNALKYSVKQQWKVRKRFALLEQKVKHNTAGYTADDTVDFELWKILPQFEYKILRMIYIEGYTIHEVADFLGITYETCKKRVQLAKRKLSLEIN